MHFLVGALLALASGKAERRQVHPLEIVSVKSVVKKIAAINPVNPSSCLVHFLVGALLALASGKAERRQVHPLEIVSVKSDVKKVAAVIRLIR